MKRIMAKDDVLQDEILKRGLTIVSFAKDLGVHRQAIYKYINKSNGVAPDKANKICKLLGKKFDDLFEIVDKN